MFTFPNKRPRVISCEVIDIRLSASPGQTSVMDNDLQGRSEQPSPGSSEPRSGSPSPSVVSVTPSARERLVDFDTDGRAYPTTGFYPNPLRPDNLKYDLSNQCMKLILGGEIYFGPVDKVLFDDGTEPQKAILDLGCGEGDWAAEMALKFPHCQVIGIDLAPTTRESLPENFRMEVDDVNLDLDHHYGQFNLVHAHTIASGVRSYASLLQKISKILRPGGMIHIGEYDIRLFNDSGMVIPSPPPYIPPGHPDHMWLPIFCDALTRSIKNIGGDLDAVFEIKKWIEESGEFYDVQSVDLLIPFRPWYRNARNEREILANITGELQAKRLEEVSCWRTFQASGLSEEAVAQLIEGTKRELKQGADDGERVGFRVHVVWARRK